MQVAFCEGGNLSPASVLSKCPSCPLARSGSVLSKIVVMGWEWHHLLTPGRSSEGLWSSGSDH